MNIRWPSKNFWHRTVLGGLCTTITAALIAVSHLPLCGWLFVAGITVVQLVALSEYIQLCKIKGFSPAAPFLYWTGSAYLFLHYLAMTSPAYASLPPLLLFAGIFATGYWYFKNQKDAMANLALTAFAFVYICLPTSWLLDINFLATTPSNAPTSFWIIWLLVR